MNNILRKSLILSLTTVAIFALAPTSLIAVQPDSPGKPASTPPESPPGNPDHVPPGQQNTPPGQNIVPVADAGAPQSVIPIVTVPLDGSGSSDANDDSLTFSWSFTSVPSGSSALLSDDTAPKPTFVADEVGTYVLDLVVSDGQSYSSADSVTITANNTPPVANAGEDQSNVAIGATVTLDGSGSLDSNDDTLTYNWTIEEMPLGSGAILSSTTVKKPTFIADRDGSYIIQLIVSDGYTNSVPDSVTVTAVSVCIFYNGTEYCEITSPYTGKVWLDRNLGAARCCTGYNDTACYGDYYQWGRNTDGHEDSGSEGTYPLASNVDPDHSDFIIGHTEWVSVGVDNNGSIRSANWSETDGSSVCPVGYRVPTIYELYAELLDAESAQINNREDAYNSFLKLPSAGYRIGFGENLEEHGIVKGQEQFGIVWSSTPTETILGKLFYSRGVTFTSDLAYLDIPYVSSGNSVRCLKD